MFERYATFLPSAPGSTIPPVGIENIESKGELRAFILSVVQLPQNLQAVLAGGFLKLIETGDHNVAMGVTAVTFTASPLSATKTVAHGLGADPANIQLTADTATAYCLPLVVSHDATNIVIQGRDTADVNRSGDNTVWWAAFT